MINILLSSSSMVESALQQSNSHLRLLNYILFINDKNTAEQQFGSSMVEPAVQQSASDI